MALSGTGFLKRTTDKIRQYAFEPTAGTRFSDSELLDYIRAAWTDVMSEVNRNGPYAVARVDITVVADQAEYVLPPTMSRFVSFEKLNTSGDPEWEIMPKHRLNPVAAGFTIEGPMLRLAPTWDSGETMRITYVPDASADLFEATTAAGGWDTANGLTITAPTSVTDGSLDTRANAYCGYVLRLLSTTDADKNFEQERVITAYNNQTRVFTFAPALSPLPEDGGSDTITFEVLPSHFHLFEDVVAYSVASQIAALRGDLDKASLLNDLYGRKLRAIRLSLSQQEGRRGRHFERAIRGNRRRGTRLHSYYNV